MFSMVIIILIFIVIFIIIIGEVYSVAGLGAGESRTDGWGHVGTHRREEVRASSRWYSTVSREGPAALSAYQMY